MDGLIINSDIIRSFPRHHRREAMRLGGRTECAKAKAGISFAFCRLIAFACDHTFHVSTVRCAEQSARIALSASVHQ